jgi:membrane-bound serine protease (ClpP class)
VIAVRALDHLSPDAALLVLTIGVLLIYVELNRPGWIMPGAIGLLLSLLSIASMLRFSLRPSAVIVTAMATAFLVLGLMRRIPLPISLATATAMVWGFVYLVRGPGTALIHVPTALFCGLILSVATPLLSAIARRARRNKKGKLI